MEPCPVSRVVLSALVRSDQCTASSRFYGTELDDIGSICLQVHHHHYQKCAWRFQKAPHSLSLFLLSLLSLFMVRMLECLLLFLFSLSF